MTKEWKYTGEITSKERNKNSLLKESDIEFETVKEDKEESFNYFKLIKTRLFEKNFDNFVLPVEKKEKITEIEEYEEKTDISKEEMTELFKEIVEEINKESEVNDVYCNLVIDDKIKEVKNKEIKAKSINREKESMRILKRYKNVKIIKNDK